MSIRPFTDNELMEISKILGDTGSGLTGREIGALLARLGFPTRAKSRSAIDSSSGCATGRRRQGDHPAPG